MTKIMHLFKQIGGVALRILTACILLLLGSLLHFWMIMPKTGVLSKEEWLRLSLSQSHPIANLLEAPFGTYLFWAVLTGVVLCFLFNGRYLSFSRVKQVALISHNHWRKLLFMTIAVIDILLVQVCFIRLDKLNTFIANHIISAEDIFYTLSGTGALREISGEAGDILFLICDTFITHLSLYQSKIIDLAVVYFTYELLRILFDTRILLTENQNLLPESTPYANPSQTA
ncbi:MAG: hypothetical protein NC251_07030 [Lachnoclostridium sp.]|nr:hypothetical protein [Lachnospira sp.]MCM1248165.1 hypothetical protein [Lachnoclostridium sp.]